MALRAPGASGDSPSASLGTSSAVVLRAAPGPVAGAPPSPAAAAAAAAAAAGSAARAAAAQHMERLSAWKDSLVERLGRNTSSSTSSQPPLHAIVNSTREHDEDDGRTDALAAGAALTLAASPAVAGGAAPGGPAAAAVAALTALLSRAQAATVAASGSSNSGVDGAGLAGTTDGGSSKAVAGAGCDGSSSEVVRISRLHWRSTRGGSSSAGPTAATATCPQSSVETAPDAAGLASAAGNYSDSGSAGDMQLAAAGAAVGAGVSPALATGSGASTSGSSNLLAGPAAALAAVARRARSLRLGAGSSRPAAADAAAGPRSARPTAATAAAASSTDANASTSGGTASAASAAAGGGRPRSGPTHLIVFANGLFGSPSNWNVICEQLRGRLDMEDTLLHPSQVNRRMDTYDGIDVCGGRLADEIRQVVAAHPSLTRISVVGHSMGGLLLRYAIGLLYSPASGKVAGLAPAHYLSLATPHCGCDGGESLAQVPFIGWVPLQPVQKVLQVLSVPTAEVLFRRTGRQFFLADGIGTGGAAGGAVSGTGATAGGGGGGGGGSSSSSRGLSTAATAAVNTTSGSSSSSSSTAATASAAGFADFNAPLLYRLTADDPQRGAYFYSALAAFRSRTAYANTDGDHLVGWANSSLRFMHQLPRLPPAASAARGVVLQDPLLAAFDVRAKPDPEPQSATSAADVPVEPPPAAPTGAAAGSSSSSSSSAAAAAAVAAAAAAAQAGEAALAEVMLRRLQRLPWRRIDVSFGGAKWGLAHNNIQVTRRWLNFEGMAVAEHVADQIVALEQALQQEEAQRQQQQGAGSKAVALEPGSGSSSRPGSPALARLAPTPAAAAGAAVAQQPQQPHPEWRTQQPLLTAAAADAMMQGAAAEADEAEAQGAEAQRRGDAAPGQAISEVHAAAARELGSVDAL